MINYIIECFFYILPILLSGILFIIFLKKNWLNFLNKPIDFNTNIFGKNKTFRGLLLMPLFCFFFTLLLTILINGKNEIYIMDNLFKSFLLGLFYSVGELPNSFIKRRLDIPPGGVSKKINQKLIFLILDNIDSIVSCCLCLLIVYHIDPIFLPGIFVLASALHLSTDILLLKIKVKQQLWA